MIYCVVHPDMAGELYEKLVDYYSDNPNVTVIVDRRGGPDRRRGAPAGEFAEQRVTRDRRRARPVGSFPSVAPPAVEV